MPFESSNFNTCKTFFHKASSFSERQPQLPSGLCYCLAPCDHGYAIIRSDLWIDDLIFLYCSSQRKDPQKTLQTVLVQRFEFLLNTLGKIYQTLQLIIALEILAKLKGSS